MDTWGTATARTRRKRQMTDACPALVLAIVAERIGAEHRETLPVPDPATGPTWDACRVPPPPSRRRSRGGDPDRKGHHVHPIKLSRLRERWRRLVHVWHGRGIANAIPVEPETIP